MAADLGEGSRGRPASAPVPLPWAGRHRLGSGVRCRRTLRDHVRDRGRRILLARYPLIDVVNSLPPAERQHGSAPRLLLVNAAVSTVVAGALGVAATGSAETSSSSLALGPS